MAHVNPLPVFDQVISLIFFNILGRQADLVWHKIVQIVHFDQRCSMQESTDRLVSPKTVAIALGVSESSLKRWCDQGRIPAIKTVGGHRRIHRADVIEFARATNQNLVHREILGLPPASELVNPTLEDLQPDFVNALLRGDEQRVEQLFFDLYLNSVPLHALFDQLIAESFHKIGELWACEDADVYQERRSCEICQRLFFRIRQLIPEPKSELVAFGGTLSGDNYTLATMMTELVLRREGLTSTSLGTSIPGHSYIRAVHELKPQLVWISVSFIPDRDLFIGEFNRLAECCEQQNVPLLVGGRALTSEIRRRIKFSSFCDTMQQLTMFVTTLPFHETDSANVQNTEP